MKTKKIIEVLKFVKNYCADIINCDGCPFYGSEGNCLLINDDYNYPAQWDIESIEANLKDKEGID